MSTHMNRSRFVEINNLVEHAAQNDRGYFLFRDGSDDVLHLHGWGAHPAHLVIGRDDIIYKHPIGDRFGPRRIYRLWRASRFQ